jgi:YfiH family protein
MHRTYRLDINPMDIVTEIPLFPDGEESGGLRAFLSLALAGNMHSSKMNELPFRKLLFERLSIDESRVYSLVQKHTRNVFEVTGPVDLRMFVNREGDGLATKGELPVLCVTVADCLPIYIIDKKNRAFGIVHSGWKGTGIVMSLIGIMENRFGSKRSDLRAVIGPGIGPCCYSVPEERASLFSLEYGDDTVTSVKGRCCLDLKKANINLLEREGISDIMVSADCTSCHPHLSSARRHGKPDFSCMLAGIGRIPVIDRIQ